jgi:PAS domain S-box-containing protein
MMRQKHLSQAAGALVILLGLLVLAGWIWNLEGLKSLMPGIVSMKANSAVCFVLAGVALLLHAVSQSLALSPESTLAYSTGGKAAGRSLPQMLLVQIAARVLAFVVLGVALVTLAEYLFDLNLGLDTWLFPASARAEITPMPGRMSSATALDFVLLGAALGGLDFTVRQPRFWPAQYLTLITVVVTMLAFIGYVYGVENLYEIVPYSTIGLHTVIGSWLLCLGILFLRPDEGLTVVFVGSKPGALVARRLLPAVILLPLVVGWLGVKGERLGLYGLGFGSAFFATTLMVAFASLVWWAARELNRIEDERQVGAEALRRSNATLDGIISSALDAVISMDAQRRVVLFNPAAERMFGLLAEEAKGSSMDRFIPERFRAFLQEHVMDFAQTGATTRRMGTLATVSGLRSNGKEFPIEASISQVDVGGEKLFTVILRDITERRQAEEEVLESRQQERARRIELEALMEAVPAVVWIANDPECRLITGNKFGLEVLRAQGNANLSMTAPSSERPSHFQVLQNGQPVPDKELPMQVAGRTGQPVLGQQLEIRHADGTARWLFGNVVPLRSDSGEVRGVMATFLDITEVTQVQEKLRALAARLQAVREEERASVAREIHDVLAQDLTRLKMDIAWLDRRLAQAPEDPKVGTLRDKLRVMVELTDSAIQSVQKIATELRPIVLDSLGLCAAIEWQLADFESRSGIKCVASLPEQELSLAREHSTAIFRILQESLTNVARHAAATRVQIELRREDGRVTLTVSDNGRGIDAAQLNDPRSVGLLSMRERAELLGGQCHINGQAGLGTTVEAWVPNQKA